MFLAPDQCLRCGELGEAWPGKAWSLLCRLYKESSSFRKEWDLAKKIRVRQEVPSWRNLTGVDVLKHAGVRTKMSFWFLTLQQVTDDLHATPQSLGQAVIKVLDIDGITYIEGIIAKIMPTDPPHKYRKVSFYSDTLRSQREQTLAPENQVRENQGTDLFHHLCQESADLRKDTFYVCFCCCACCSLTDTLRLCS